MAVMAMDSLSYPPAMERSKCAGTTDMMAAANTADIGAAHGDGGRVGQIPNGCATLLVLESTIRTAG